MERVPSYQQKKGMREAKMGKLRQASGLDNEEGESISDNDAKRRAAALKNGGGLDDAR